MPPQPNGHPNGQNGKTRRVQPSETPPPSGPAPSAGPPKPVPSLEVLQADFERLVASNQARFAELAGQGTAPDPFFLLHARINHLIDSIAQFAGDNGPRWAMLTRLGFEEFIDAELQEAGPATVRMQLAEGARYTPEMIRALAVQTGTIRRTH